MCYNHEHQTIPLMSNVRTNWLRYNGLKQRHGRRRSVLGERPPKDSIRVTSHDSRVALGSQCFQHHRWKMEIIWLQCFTFCTLVRVLYRWRCYLWDCISCSNRCLSQKLLFQTFCSKYNLNKRKLEQMFCSIYPLKQISLE